MITRHELVLGSEALAADGGAAATLALRMATPGVASLAEISDLARRDRVGFSAAGATTLDLLRSQKAATVITANASLAADAVLFMCAWPATDYRPWTVDCGLSLNPSAPTRAGWPPLRLRCGW